GATPGRRHAGDARLRARRRAGLRAPAGRVRPLRTLVAGPLLPTAGTAEGGRRYLFIADRRPPAADGLPGSLAGTGSLAGRALDVRDLPVRPGVVSDRAARG